MYKIAILTLYFGKFPNYFNLWLQSCANNSDFDFWIITDQSIPDTPNNVIVINDNLQNIKSRFESAIGRPVTLQHPYKLCDYKPMYGTAFKDILQEYDFWGHCDIDLIWGDLKKFITKDILDKYDKVFPLGHLSLYRNTTEVSEYFRLPGSLRGDYSEVISTEKSCVFDERYGINKIFEFNSLPIYLKEVAADIGFRNKRMIIAGTQIANYPHQLFYIKDGRCLRAFHADGKIQYDEFSYIHLQKRPYKNTINTTDYIVAQDEFLPLPDHIDLELIKKINPYPGKLMERFEYLYKDCKFRIIRKIKQLSM